MVADASTRDGGGRLRCVHVIAGLAPHNGGVAYSAPRLCSALREQGVEATIETLQEPGAPEASWITAHPTALARAPLVGRLRFSPNLRAALRARAGTVNVVHSHGLWLMANVYAGEAAQRAGTPLVVSPRGMAAAEALRFSAFQKRAFWAALQKRAYAKAACWHATSAEEAQDIRAFGIDAPIAIVPNGIDLPEAPAEPRPGERHTLLFLSRLHPKKGLATLIDAWARLAPERPDWELVIAGPDEGGHRAELEAKARALSVERVRFCGAIYGAEKQTLLSNAALFVLPTLNENFGLAVAEALAAGTPAVVTKGAPWSGLLAERCGWWIDHGVDALTAALLEATALPAAVRRDMGARGRAWMARDFSWSSVAARMTHTYSWILGRDERPDFIV